MTAQIVVMRWYEYGGGPPFGYATAEFAMYDDWEYFYIYGACFPPDELVTITVCDENYVIAEVEANDCGAFYVYCAAVWAYSDYISDYYFGYWEPLLDTTFSVRAWVDADTVVDEVVTPEDPESYPWLEDTEIQRVVDGDMMANWPLYLYYD
jgi:hypothetical protein